MKTKLFIVLSFISLFSCYLLAHDSGVVRREHGDVYKLTAGTNMSVSPSNGLGNVTVSANNYLSVSSITINNKTLTVSTGSLATSSLKIGGVEVSTPSSGYGAYTLIYCLEGDNLLISTKTVTDVGCWKQLKDVRLDE